MIVRELDCCIIIPVHNRWDYTRQCLEGIFTSDARVREVIVVDNASKDETSAGLKGYPQLKVLTNSTNEGCAKAWNAGLNASCNARWKIILNNDVLLTPWTLSGLVDSAERLGLGIVCPAMWQGPLDYDLTEISAKLRSTLKDTPRLGFLHGVCFCVNQDVFETLGTFDEKFVLGQYEDADFFRRTKAAGFACATVSDSFLHHYGSMTQLALREEGRLDYAIENRRYFRRKWQLTWFKRKAEKLWLLLQIWNMERRERALTNCVMVR
jgi:N-acetylglucosaminyl-diphospho-decaprenol L-rhamnosyltransferase